MNSSKKKDRYEELRTYFRAKLLDHIQNEGFNRSQIQILEALLRLRQASCHFGLIDNKHSSEEGPKLRVLLEHIEELIESGHKALVFSQFTSLLSILGERLDLKKIRYEYLDGKTTNRKQRVERFQTDPECPLFLLSLKAGGVGLNLTKADYVFILDPWWNPAVESQAIDRAHRIGQSKPVMVYRLITKNTVEEKVLALQEKKRLLAKSLISDDQAILRKVTPEDLELLLE